MESDFFPSAAGVCHGLSEEVEPGRHDGYSRIAVGWLPTDMDPSGACLAFSGLAQSATSIVSKRYFAMGAEETCLHHTHIEAQSSLR